MSDIFLSYSQKDEDRVRPIVEQLEAQGWSVFWDRNIPPGKTWEEYIEMHLDAARCVVVVWSKDSVRSHWVRTEAEEGRRKNILVPLKIDEVTLSLAFRHIHAADLTCWNNDASHVQFKACIDAIAALIPKRIAKSDATVKVSVTQVARPVAEPQLPENFVLIKGNTFTMGSPKIEKEKSGLEIQHKVKLSDFAICRYVVTVEEYLEFTQETERRYSEWKEKACEYNITTGSDTHFKKHSETLTGERYPIFGVSWEDALAYCEWLSEKRGGTYRLPTEAEWEYACRAGTTTPFNTGENLTTDQANYDGNFPYRKYPKGEFRGKPVPVGSFKPNGYGLYNMHGNVWEWCSDWHEDGYYEECRKNGLVENPLGSESGMNKVLRGGFWGSRAGYCRSATRGCDFPSLRHLAGFRLVFVPQFSVAHPAKKE